MTYEPLTSEQEIRDRQEDLFRTLNNPVGMLCKFYSLYYLTEIGNVTNPNVVTEFQRTQTELARAFRFYTLIAVSMEVRTADFLNMPDGSGQRGDAWADDRTRSEGIQDLQEMFGVDEEVAEVCWYIVSEMHDVGYNFNDTMEMFLAFEDDANIFSEPVTFLKAAEAMFNVEFDPPQGWMYGYGGPAWAAIARHGLRANQLTRVAWINQSWAIQHNNANWMDKLDFGDETLGKIAAFFEAMTGRTVNPTREMVLETILDRLLQERKEGYFTNVFEGAARFHEDDPVAYRRYITRFGYPQFGTQAVTLSPEQLDMLWRSTLYLIEDPDQDSPYDPAMQKILLGTLGEQLDRAIGGDGVATVEVDAYANTKLIRALQDQMMRFRNTGDSSVVGLSGNALPDYRVEQRLQETIRAFRDQAPTWEEQL